MSSRTRYIAPKRVEEAFGPHAADAYLAVVVSVVGDRLQIRLLRGEEREIVPRDAPVVASTLEQHDITRVHGRPLLLVNEFRCLVAIATGPAEPPERLEVSAHFVRLGEHGAVEMIGSGDLQPSWLLFEIERGDAETPRQ